MITWEIPIRVAELLLAVVFVLGGLGTLRNPQPRAEQLARFRLPFPILLVRLNGVVMIAAGLALALNIMPGLASAALAAVLVPTTVLGHPFWAAEGTARQEQLAHFIKNLAGPYKASDRDEIMGFLRASRWNTVCESPP